MDPRATPPAGAVAREFQLDGEIRGIHPYGGGHINATFRVETGTRSFVLQRVNGAIFPDPVAVMDNVVRVTEHLQRKLEEEGCTEPHRRALSLVPTRDGRTFIADAEGAVWRCYPFIERSRTVERLENEGQAIEAGRAFGEFQRRLADLSGPALHATIPRFHDASFRFANFTAAVDSDVANRAVQAVPEIRFALSQRDLAGFFAGFERGGEMRPRVTHNDTKLNNLLFDQETGGALCVVDLDTVMPGLALYDFGDLARSACCAAVEDEVRLDRVQADPVLFSALARGFREGTGLGLNAVERENLVGATQVITYSLGLRFLTDFLEGDRYFRIHREGHNLDRTRMQFALLRNLQEREAELRGIIA